MNIARAYLSDQAVESNQKKNWQSICSKTLVMEVNTDA